MHPLWSEKFEIKPGQWVFVPTAECRESGTLIKNEVSARWAPPSYMYHLKMGGHVAALQAHLNSTSFARFDIQNYFSSINRTRITRALKTLTNYDHAREWARLSVVRAPTNMAQWCLPFGFVQSPIIAALCLAKSALGTCFDKIYLEKKVVITVYVDDIIVSSRNFSHTMHWVRKIEEAAARSSFQLNELKQAGPSRSVSAFNIDLSHQSLVVQEDRMQRFRIAFRTAKSDEQANGILNYVASVNSGQVAQL